MALDHNPFDAYQSSQSSSTGDSSKGRNSTKIVLTLLAVVLGAALVAGIIVALNDWREGTSSSGTSASSTYQPADPTSTREPSDTFTGAGRPDDSTGDPFDGGIADIDLPPAMQEQLDSEFFHEARLTKYTGSNFEGREYGVEATMTANALEDPAGLVNAMNKLTKDYCFWGFTAQGAKSADTRINLGSTCEQENPTEPMASVITALKDYSPHEIRQNPNVENGFDAYFWNATRNDLEDMRGVEGANITAYVAKDGSDIVDYNVTPDGLERK